MATPTSAPNPPTSILSLPAELHIAIALKLDLPSALSIARVSRVFCAAAAYRIWRAIDVQVKRTSIPIYVAEAGGLLANGKDAESSAAAKLAIREQVLAAIRAKVATVAGQAAGQKGSMIRAVKLVSGAAVPAQMEILRIASANLESLTINGLPREDAIPHRELFNHHLFAHISFPALTHVFLSFGSYHTSALVIALCNAAPSVAHLAVCIATEEPASTPIAALPQPTKLRELRLLSQSQRISPITTFWAFQIITQSPAMRKIAVSYVPSGSLVSGKMYTVVFAASAKEGQVHCGHPDGLQGVEGDQGHLNVDVCSEGSQRVLWMALQRFRLLDHIPKLRHVDTLYLGKRDPSTTATSSLSLIEADPRTDDQDIFTRLDQLDRATGSPVGRIRSLFHQGQELVLAALLLPQTANVHALPPSPPLALPPHITNAHEHPTMSETSPRDAVEPEARTSWLQFSDLDGVKVPLGVIRRILVAQGVNEQEWTGRGLDVGDEAWAVLRRWQETGDEGQDEEEEGAEGNTV